MRLSVVSTVVLVSVALSSAAFATSPDTKRTVLQLSDLPAGFTLTKGHYSDNARSAKESTSVTLADYKRWGRITGYDADYGRDGIVGILEIDSVSNLYKTAKGATASLHDAFAAATKPATISGKTVVFQPTSMGTPLGDEARMYQANMKSGSISITLYAVAWRYHTIKASLLVGGLRNTVDASDVVALATKQQARIRTAVG